MDGYHLTQSTTDAAGHQGEDSTNLAGPTGKPLKKNKLQFYFPADTKSI